MTPRLASYRGLSLNGFHRLAYWEWGLPDHAALAATDLMRGHRFVWTGKSQHIRLDPADLPFAVWQIAPPGAA